MSHHTSINDELQEFKKKALEYNKQIFKIEKIGNGNMAAFRVFYKDTNDNTLKEHFFWRHDMDRLLQIFKEEQR